MSVQQYRPRSPASVVPQGNAANHALVGSAAATHTEQVNQGVNVCVKCNLVAISFLVFLCMQAGGVASQWLGLGPV